ncbi:GNAT family N-acetyltransferase [Nocardioides sp. Kera G14]|uniref:GNAT family N-acetyltransferase n=1 Tax=Nocardioides sp. Kera G14 TaxID=2884264 RepID=UPI001D12D680|nr:GNAT family N-acetyltransferase [Nocardioides sp. Kera G14]UDY22431.1 GNAT family N-acetyltransferase [Nocardioides sp. Kera G14]
MTRSMVTLREATVEDALALTELWADLLRRADAQEQAADLETVIKDSADSAEQRIVVAEYDGEFAGAVLLRITTLTPLNLTPTVLILAPHVASRFRRRGVGHALMDAGTTWAEENGIGHVTGGAAHGTREANRYLARLGLGASAIFRVGTTQAMRDKLTEQLPVSQRVPGYRPQRVLAARRIRRANSAG